ncbi:antitoxin component YwqK of YwqJK toxin-antitoxin module [Elusimicrobium posterum]|uniref:toxin-antitoxin system YwqK family antitoxin n=1 Tax=Elusimicrobium posterum TaxID=3116653 RepID=UPI003C777996
MDEKIISVASPKRKIYFMAVPIAEETLDENGRVESARGAIPDGPVVEFNATLKTLKNYKNGVLHGKLQVADINSGKVSFTEEYEDGELKEIIDTGTLSPISPKHVSSVEGQTVERDLSKEGLVYVRTKESIIFYDNGKEVAKRSLQDGSLLAGKIPDGVIREFWENGRLKTQAQYKNGIIDGELTRYDEAQRLLSKEFYKEGVLEGPAEYTLYLPTADVFERATYKNGLLEGQRRMFLSDTHPIVTENFVNGKLEGKREVYFETSGILSMEENYKNGRYHGNRILYHNNGAVWYKEYYENGQLNGERIAYFPTGELYLKERYVKGLLEGEKNVYDQHGTVLFKEEYSFGSPVKKRKY